MQTETVNARQLTETASKAIKWTTLAEVLAKLIVPITNMILARFLTPEIFGIVASVNVIISFAEMISEGGFAKYILQQKFSTDDQKKKTIATGLTVSLIFGLLLFSVVLIFKDPLSVFVEASGYSWLLVFAAVQIPFYSLTNVLISLCRRRFKFKQLTFVRLGGVSCQLLVAVVLAVSGLSIWAITAGSMASIIIQFAFALLIARKDVRIGFDFNSFKNMWSASFLYLLSALIVWLNSSLNTIFASKFFGQDVSGILKNGFSTIGGIVTMLTAIYSPVLTTLLAKIDYKTPDFSKTIYRFQKAMSAIFIPLGIGMLVYNRYLTEVFFGEGWEAAGIVIACIGLANSIKVSTCDFIFSGMNACGKPLWNLVFDLVNTLCLLIIWPVCRNQDFHLIVILLGCAYLLETGVCLCFSKLTIGVSSTPLLKNVLMVLPCAVLMGLVGYFLSLLSTNLIFNTLFIVFCIIFYFFVLFVVYPHYWSLMKGVFGINLGKSKKRIAKGFGFSRDY